MSVRIRLGENCQAGIGYLDGLESLLVCKLIPLFVAEAVREINYEHIV
jgi:hypothetical protein